MSLSGFQVRVHLCSALNPNPESLGNVPELHEEAQLEEAEEEAAAQAKAKTAIQDEDFNANTNWMA